MVRGSVERGCRRSPHDKATYSEPLGPGSTAAAALPLPLQPAAVCASLLCSYGSTPFVHSYGIFLANSYTFFKPQLEGHPGMTVRITVLSPVLLSV